MLLDKIKLVIILQIFKILYLFFKVIYKKIEKMARKFKLVKDSSSSSVLKSKDFILKKWLSVDILLYSLWFFTF